MLVDTSVWIDYFNGYGSPEAVRLVSAIAENDPLVLPGIVMAEILLGARNEAEAENLEEILRSFDATPPWDEADYREAARIYRVCRGAGFAPRSTIDCLIAQTCLRHDLDLLTRDRDFRVIAAHFPLRLTTAKQN